jgi:hypothetical protein
LPSEETTPPVMKTYRAMGLDHTLKWGRVGSPNKGGGTAYQSDSCELAYCDCGACGAGGAGGAPGDAGAGAAGI